MFEGDPDAEIDRLRNLFRELQYELKAAEVERDFRGGQHTNGPKPRLLAITGSALHLLKRIVREAIGDLTE